MSWPLSEHSGPPSVTLTTQIWYRDSDFLVISPWFSRDFSVARPSHERRGGCDHVPGHDHENKKLVLRPLTIVHEVEFDREEKACFWGNKFNNELSFSDMLLYIVNS